MVYGQFLYRKYYLVTRLTAHNFTKLLISRQRTARSYRNIVHATIKSEFSLDGRLYFIGNTTGYNLASVYMRKLCNA